MQYNLVLLHKVINVPHMAYHADEVHQNHKEKMISTYTSWQQAGGLRNSVFRSSDPRLRLHVLRSKYSDAKLVKTYHVEKKQLYQSQSSCLVYLSAYHYFDDLRTEQSASDR